MASGLHGALNKQKIAYFSIVFAGKAHPNDSGGKKRASPASG
ncbi:MAG: hypothetical protein ACE14P_06435 [Methanotrichaceae archaeon]